MAGAALVPSILPIDYRQIVLYVDASAEGPNRLLKSVPQSVWREPPDWLNQSKGTGTVSCQYHSFHSDLAMVRKNTDFVAIPVLSAPIFHTWPRRKTHMTKSNPGMGISQIEWNTDGTCLAVRSGKLHIKRSSSWDSTKQYDVQGRYQR